MLEYSTDKMPYKTKNALTFEIKFKGNFVGMLFIEDNGDGIDILEMIFYNSKDFKELVQPILEASNVTYEVTKNEKYHILKVYNIWEHEKRNQIEKHLVGLHMKNLSIVKTDLTNNFKNF